MFKTASISLALSLFAALFVFAPAHADAQAKPLKNVAVTGEAVKLVDGVVTDTFDFTGKVTIQALDVVNNELVAAGVVKGVVDGQHVTQSFANVPLVLSATDPGLLSPAALGTCDILFLDLGPLHLDLLGLELDLSEVVLDLDAVAGPGNLLGNLLCALTGLLDGGGLLGGLLGDILDLIDQINELV